MEKERHELKLGKGASFFVKSQLKSLRQEDDTWEADFFPIPCSESEHDSVCWGIVLSHDHDKVLAQRMVEEPPTVNDLANLVAEAPYGVPWLTCRIGHNSLYLRARPEWAELLPHLKQIGVKAVAQDGLPKWDHNFGDLQPQVERAREQRYPQPGESNVMPDNTDYSARALQELVRVLEEAVRAGVSSVGLEYKGRDLIVFHNVGSLGLGVSHMSQELQQAVIEEMVKRAGLSRKSKGKMQVRLLGRDYQVVVEEYESFGESAYNLCLQERKRKEGH